MRTITIISILTIFLGTLGNSFAQESNIEKIKKEEVKKALLQFQDGYTNRDTSAIDEFLEMFSDDIVYMGIASHEFFKGKESVRKLTLWDWERWFDLKVPIAEENIRIDIDVAWFEVIGESGPWRDGNTYEIRMVGSLVNSDNKWLFKQICFSYPAPLKVIE